MTSCEHKKTHWRDYLTIYESFQFLQCVDCGEVLKRRNYARGLRKREEPKSI